MGCWSTRGRGLVASRNESSDSRNNWKLIWIEEWTQRGLLWLWVVMGFCKQYYRATFSCTNTKGYKSTCSKDAHFGVGKRKKKSYVLDNSISVKERRPKCDLICTSELSSLRYGKKPSLADSLSSPLMPCFLQRQKVSTWFLAEWFCRAEIFGRQSNRPVITWLKWGKCGKAVSGTGQGVPGEKDSRLS